MKSNRRQYIESLALNRQSKSIKQVISNKDYLFSEHLPFSEIPRGVCNL